MSGQDIRDILQITKSTETKKVKTTAEKRPEGISRELYSLIGGAPPVAFVKPIYKAKFQTKKKATPWVWSSFTNPARDDDLELHHWVKSTEPDNQAYAFSKFNKVIDILEYSDEDYAKYLTDADWTKEETDYLFGLCKQYDLRFPVIEDRYTYPNKTRTMEDLKDRYYAVNRTLILQGRGTAYSTDRQSLAHQYAYDKNREIERKNALIVLFNRTKEQVDEEEALFVEAKRIEMNEARLSKERESLLNSLQLEQIQPLMTPVHSISNSSLASPGGIGITGGTAGGNHTSDKKKKKVSEEQKKGRKLSTASSIIEDIDKKEKLTPGVYIRSQKLPVVKPTMQPKVVKVLEELGIGPRPIMPTATVCHKFDNLQNSILAMFDLKKVVDKIEMEHKVKVQKGKEGRKRSTSIVISGSGHRDKRRK
ncbi:hypothetical protein BDB01DRAFT_783917 [Pilobolus umbonatus]|nr:hypothetical protein BDB01DRAFT_783917 [Pilobolus umbonatus]